MPGISPCVLDGLPRGGQITPSQLRSLHFQSGDFGFFLPTRLSHIPPPHFGHWREVEAGEGSGVSLVSILAELVTVVERSMPLPPPAAPSSSSAPLISSTHLTLPAFIPRRALSTTNSSSSICSRSLASFGDFGSSLVTAFTAHFFEYHGGHAPTISAFHCLENFSRMASISSWYRNTALQFVNVCQRIAYAPISSPRCDGGSG